ncbi:MAG: fused response regulator/phosphatase [Candidatus Tectomicrobia bacterium]|uniref:Fused response regulator/phosphatase n=1 Tax=Tectimicrobiota bacterium TaxID=2528274 RepID=A0A937W2I6_UNCTE|nr:fused response regulator/phosphatase [Candidatus Tectomicrobia bacterium]
MSTTILIVDDVRLNRRMLMAMLRHEGYVFLEAANGQEAVDLALSHLPDLIILDIVMPVLDGYAACNLVKQHELGKDIPIIFLTSLDDQSTKVKCLNTGAVDYITKPFHKDEVLSRVKNQLRLQHITKALITTNQALREKQRSLDEDLQAAAHIQQSLILKQPPLLRQLQVAWRHLPCERISGDIFNIYQLDEDHCALFMLDVCGHGISAAMVTVSVSQSLAPQTGYLLKQRRQPPQHYMITSPVEVLTQLDTEYPLERFGRHFTLVYLVLNCRTGQLRYSSAAHPPPLLLRRDGEVIPLTAGGPVIGLGDLVPFEEGEVWLVPGERRFLYTDGIIELMNPQEEMFGEPRLTAVLRASQGAPVHTVCDQLIEALFAYGAGTPPQDDMSVLALEYQGQ